MTMIDRKTWNQLKTNFVQSRPAIENPKSLGGEKFKAIEKYWYGLQKTVSKHLKCSNIVLSMGVKIARH